jgi:MinD-like ATPase involved in chromosome partitioning or flagellar assembly
MKVKEKLTAPGSERALRVLLAPDLQAVSDLQLLMGELQADNPYNLEVAGVAREGTLVYPDAVEKDADVVLLSPTIPGYSPEVIQRLFHYEERPVLTVALVPATGDWAVTMEKAGAVGHLTTPLSPESLPRLAAMLPPAVRDAYAHRASDSYIPRLSPQVAQVVDRGGWRRQSVGFWAPSGGVGKTTLSVNVAAALGVIANKRTLLVDTDMNKGDAHLLLDLEGEERNIYAVAKQLASFGKLSAADVKRFLTPYGSSNLSVLIGIPQTWMASDKESLAGEQGMRFARQLLEVIEPVYDFIVFDLGQTYNHPVHLTILQHVDLIFLVVNSTVTSLYAGHKALGALRQAGLLEGDRLRVVVNRYHPRHGISRREVQDALDGLPTFVEIAAEEDQEVVIALNTGEPVVLSNPTTEVAKNILELSATLYPPLTDIRRLQEGRQGGILGKLFGGLANP